MKSRGVTFIVSWSQNNREVFELSLPNHTQYCARHGYHLQNIEEPYNKYVDTDRIRQNLERFDVVVTLGTDVVFQHMECPLWPFFPLHGIAMAPQHGDGVLNGDFIIFTRCDETTAILDCLDTFQHSRQHGQEALNEMYVGGGYWICAFPHLQIAAPAMNPGVDYSSVDVSEYLALHYHTMGAVPVPKDKAAAMRQDIENEK